jgi:hypothetical protein
MVPGGAVKALQEQQGNLFLRQRCQGLVRPSHLSPVHARRHKLPGPMAVQTPLEEIA